MLPSGAARKQAREEGGVSSLIRTREKDSHTCDGVRLEHVHIAPIAVVVASGGRVEGDRVREVKQLAGGGGGARPEKQAAQDQRDGEHAG